MKQKNNSKFKIQNSNLDFAPIVLFVYNRLDHTRQTVEALKKNELAEESDLFIYSDGAKNEDAVPKVNEVRQYIQTIDGFKKVMIIERKKNWGLANSIIDGVTKTVNEYGKVIVLEDDLVTSPYFLKFMNEALNVYKEREDIFVISGYSPFVNIPVNYKHEVYLTHRSSSWGWATWIDEWSSVKWDHRYYKQYVEDFKIMQEFGLKGGKDRPEMLKAQMENKINSWAIRRGFTQFLHKKYTLFPVQTLINNIGHDGSGVHCGVNSNFDNQNSLTEKINLKLPSEISENQLISKSIYRYYTPSLLKRIKNKLLKVLNSE